MNSANILKELKKQIVNFFKKNEYELETWFDRNKPAAVKPAAFIKSLLLCAKVILFITPIINTIALYYNVFSSPKSSWPLSTSSWSASSSAIEAADSSSITSSVMTAVASRMVLILFLTIGRKGT